MPHLSGATAGTAADLVQREFAERHAQQRAQSLGLPYVSLQRRPLSPDLLQLVPLPLAQSAQALPTAQSGVQVQLAVVDPSHPAVSDVQAHLTAQRLSPILALCSPESLREVWPQMEAAHTGKKQVITRTHTTEGDTLEGQRSDFIALQRELPTLHPQAALAEVKLAALSAQASDIHLQPSAAGSTLRFRIDGLLYDIFTLDHDTTAKLRTQIKYESGLRTNVANVPQDGASTTTINGRLIDFRVATLPTPHDESIVIRLLDSHKAIKPYTKLGLHPRACAVLEQAITQPNGLILVTGPTGSGKTTTLYSILSELNQPEVKLVTLEDPIEYHLDGVSQSQIDETWDYSFSTGLKAILRHDPDVILVGEVRTADTAAMVVESAMTGHLVLTSLHTNSAAGAITRLRNLGLPDHDIAPTLRAVFSQRLLRQVCPDCVTMVPYAPTPEQQTLWNSLQSKGVHGEVPATVPAAQGCDACSHTGYLGRAAICEAFLVDAETEHELFHGASEVQLREFLSAHKQFISLRESGLLQVAAGQTTVEEVWRIA